MGNIQEFADGNSFSMPEGGPLLSTNAPPSPCARCGLETPAVTGGRRAGLCAGEQGPRVAASDIKDRFYESIVLFFHYRRKVCGNQVKTIVGGSLLNLHWFNADPDQDPAFNLSADTDPDPGPGS
jgi:hypothetical protein